MHYDEIDEIISAMNNLKNKTTIVTEDRSALFSKKFLNSIVKT